MIKNWKQFNESKRFDDISIINLFRKYEKEYKPEFNSENYIEFHRNDNGGINALRESLELIGNGEITESDGRLKYIELLDGGTVKLVVYAWLKKSPYGGAKGYNYEINLNKNDESVKQIGGGYGASPIMHNSSSSLFHFYDADLILKNRNIISNVCKDIIGVVNRC